MKKRWLGAVAAAVLMAAVLAGCGQKEVSQDFYAMDTAMNIRAYGSHAQDAINQCVQYINGLEQDISRTQEDSELYALNHADGKPVELSEQTADVLGQALRLAEETEGCFDPTTAPLSDLWGIGTEQAKVPAQAEIDEALALVGYQRVQIDGTSASSRRSLRSAEIFMSSGRRRTACHGQSASPTRTIRATILRRSASVIPVL